MSFEAVLEQINNAACAGILEVQNGKTTYTVETYGDVHFKMRGDQTLAIFLADTGELYKMLIPQGSTALFRSHNSTKES